MSGLLTALQTALTSVTKNFLLVAVLPVLCLAAANGALLWTVDPARTNAWWARLTTVEGSATAVVAVLVAALLLTSVQPWLVQALEGDHLPRFLRRRLHREQVDRLDELREAFKQASSEFDRFRTRDELLRKIILPETGGQAPDAALVHDVGELNERRRNGDPITFAELVGIVNRFAPFVLPGAGPVPETLRTARETLILVIGFASDRSRHDLISVSNYLQSQFPGDVFRVESMSDNVLAPTRFGNIGRTMRSYGLRRYSLDLDIFWTRLQQVMAAAEGGMHETLQSQKAIVDFLVTLFWFAMVVGLVWVPWLAYTQTQPAVFRGLVIAIPVAMLLLYRGSCRAYMVFADQVRAAVDLFRFKVLEELQMQRPAGTDEENIIWDRLGRQIGYANRDARFIYARRS
jgi:hypothetical protein